jgi:hypothetical protein
VPIEVYFRKLTQLPLADDFGYLPFKNKRGEDKTGEGSRFFSNEKLEMTEIEDTNEC